MQFINIQTVKAITSLSRSTIYEKIKNDTFPAQKKISTRRVAWSLDEVEDWMKKFSS